MSSRSAADRAFTRNEISGDQAIDYLMALHQLGVGAAVNALAELDSVLAQRLAERLRTSIDGSVKRLSKTSFDAEEPIHEQATTERFRNKSPSVLQREYLFFRELTRSNQEIPFARLLELVRPLDPSVKGPTITAHLDRLTKEGLISRKRKGLYGATLRSRGYLQGLIAELEARGESPPNS
jgi:hypothetical protein